MLQLLVHPDSVFYVLLRESPPDDILNEPRRKPLSSLEGPGGNCSDCFLLDPALAFDRQRRWSGLANETAEWAALPIRGQETQRWACQQQATLIDHMQGESLDPRLTLDDEDEKRGVDGCETIWMLFAQGYPFILAFVPPLLYPLLIFRLGKVSLNSEFRVVSWAIVNTK